VNCVEVVGRLMADGLVDLVVTTDGREYVTRAYLVVEVQNECLAADGRIPLTVVAAALSVELDHVVAAATDLVRQSEPPGEFLLCAGELIHR
jgi:hypothetical protein